MTFDLTSYNFTIEKKDTFLIITYDTDKQRIFNISEKLAYAPAHGSTDFLHILKTDDPLVKLDYTKSTNPTASSRDDFFHILRKLISTSTHDYLTEVALGRIESAEIYLKFGENHSIGVTSETLWCQGGDWQPLVGTTGETMNIVSASSNDVAVTGTGARSLLIYGLTTDDVQLTEVIALNGTTQVTTTNLFNHIHRVVVFSAGSNYNNEGDVTLTASTAGTVQALVPANGGITQQLFYKTPKDKRIQVKSGLVTVHSTGAANPKVTFEMWYHYTSGVRIKTVSLFIDTSICTSQKLSNEVCPFLPTGTIVEIRCFSDTANTKVSGDLNLLIEDIH